MSASFYDLVQPGMIQNIGSHTFERDEIIEFAQEYDPQPFHLSEDAAKDALFGALCASGWHTVSAWMRLNVDAGHAELLQLTGHQGAPPVFGPSPGVRNVRWLRPVFVGDTISYRSEVTGKKPSRNREGWGILTNQTTGWNQNGKQVLSMDGSVTLRMD